MLRCTKRVRDYVEKHIKKDDVITYIVREIGI